MLVQLTNKGSNSLQYLIIFIGILLFLASVNIFAARIWGDIYSVISQNITSAIGAHGMLSSIVNPISKSILNNSKGLNGGHNFNMLNIDKPVINTNPSIDLGNNNSPTAQTNDNNPLQPKSAEPKDNRSTITKALDGAGFNVQANKDGTTSVSGLFYANKNSDGELSTLYINKDDAINDGVIPQNVQTVGLNNLNILDTSNGKATNKYNNVVNQIAASSGVKASDINIGQNSLDKKIYESMTLAKNENLIKNIQGLGIKNDLRTGSRTNSLDNRIKIIAYKEVINNKLNGTS
jgi:hypothetical protein